jgi:hypothetical protein
MKRRNKICIIVTTFWILLSLAPYVVVGRSWGMVWFVVNLPLSEILKSSLWGYGSITYVILVTVINSIVLSIIATGIACVWTRLGLRRT